MNKKFEIFNIEKHWDDFLNGEIAVNCETEVLANEFLKYCHENGIKWGSEKYLINENYWRDHKNETCYKYNKGKSYSGLSFDNIVGHYEKEKDVIIVKFEGFNNVNNEEEDIENKMENVKTLKLLLFENLYEYFDVEDFNELKIKLKENENFQKFISHPRVKIDLFYSIWYYEEDEHEFDFIKDIIKKNNIWRSVDYLHEIYTENNEIKFEDLEICDEIEFYIKKLLHDNYYDLNAIPFDIDKLIVESLKDIVIFAIENQIKELMKFSLKFEIIIKVLQKKLEKAKSMKNCEFKLSLCRIK